jgi:hypothetical protein
MTLHVIGAGVGRTGTYSLKLAMNQLGLGPCHHMEEVLQHMPAQVPLWSAAASGQADWSRIYSGYKSAVDWPTACFFRELAGEFPQSQFVLTVREPRRWAESFSATIYTLLQGKEQAPPEMREWLEMAAEVIAKTGFRFGLSHEELVLAFNAHNNAVREAIPANRLLVFEVKDGWQPLCDFLETPVPASDFPRTNHREEFWDRVNGKI